MIAQLTKRYLKKIILLGSDLFFVCIALPAALYTRLEPTAFLQSLSSLNAQHWAVVFFSYLFAFLTLKTYRTIVRLANLFTALRIAVAVFLGASISFLLANFIVPAPLLPRSTYLIQMLLVVPLCLSTRFSIRIFTRYSRGAEEGIPTLVYGAGLTTDRFLPFVLQHQKNEIRVVGLIDDDSAKRGSEVQGIRVRGNRSVIPKLVAKYGVKQVILAMPSATGVQIRAIVDSLYEQNLKVKILPAVEDYVNGIGTRELEFRDVNIEDLLRRAPRNINKVAVAKILRGKTVLVTGGGGSIGSELVRQIAALEPSRLIVNDVSEFSLYQITEEIRGKYPNLELVSNLSNMAEERACANLFSKCRIDAVFHACAYKHVPLVEENVSSAILNNILSAKNVFEQAVESGAERVVLISSDKAVRPTNVMGATKRVCELLALWYANNQSQKHKCSFSAVRFGNVLGSSGSVVPKFVEQIRSGGPVTVTHPEITRYFMLIPEAVSLVLQAATASVSGEIFVLNMGEPIKIVDMAKDLIRLMGKQYGRDIKIEFSGLRPGEKLYEELQLETENIESVTEDFFKLARLAVPASDFMKQVEQIVGGALNHAESNARECLFSLVKEYELGSRSETRTTVSEAERHILPFKSKHTSSRI